MFFTEFYIRLEPLKPLKCVNLSDSQWSFNSCLWRSVRLRYSVKIWWMYYVRRESSESTGCAILGGFSSVGEVRLSRYQIFCDGVVSVKLDHCGVLYRVALTIIFGS